MGKFFLKFLKWEGGVQNKMSLWWNIGNLALKLRDLFFRLNKILTAWKVSKCGAFSGPYFPAFGLNTERYVFSTDNNTEDDTEWYGLKSPYSPRQAKELIPFENDLVALIRNIKFRKIRNTFQEKLKEDIKLIKDSHKTMTFADKTSNMYRLTKE